MSVGIPALKDAYEPHGHGGTVDMAASGRIGSHRTECPRTRPSDLARRWRLVGPGDTSENPAGAGGWDAAGAAPTSAASSAAAVTAATTIRFRKDLYVLGLIIRVFYHTRSRQVLGRPND